MCTLAAFPRLFKRDRAIEIARKLALGQRDGFGVGYWLNNKPVIRKTKEYFLSAGDVKSWFSHMPHDGWTIVHFRSASEGAISDENAHPFITTDGRFLFCHNGGMKEFKLIRDFIIDKDKLTSETDSEVLGNFVARYLDDKDGYGKIHGYIGSVGRFLFLDSSDNLYAVNLTNSRLIMSSVGNSSVIASENVGDEESWWIDDCVMLADKEFKYYTLSCRPGGGIKRMLLPKKSRKRFALFDGWSI